MQGKRFPLLALLVAVAALALAACGDGDDSTTESETEAAPAATETTTDTAPAEGQTAPKGSLERSVKVEIADFAYAPEPARVETGGKVTWQNRDSAPHTATADDGSFDTGTLEQNKLGSESFKKAGTYSYFCEIHPDMRGTVEVVDAE